MSVQLNTKKIAKNTILLYFRMILGLLVSLYTSRVVLNVLGISDFGIYNLISGVIVLFSFVNTFLTSGCQRFISFSLAKNTIEETKKVFSTSLLIHVIILIIFAFLAETIGLWFTYNKVVIPPDRLDAAIWTFHIMVIESCISILKVPYNAAIISEERMGFYAWTSIVENVLRLVVVYLLAILPYDKLILYSILHIGVSLLVFLWYKVYSEKNFKYCTFSLKYDKGYLKQLLSFSGWNLFGSLADVGYKQATNIILNVFYGVTLNAAMGLATTVRSSIYSFITNIQVAANPQIIKSYAIENYEYFLSLIIRISKYSYYLMLFFAVPVIINIEFILELWLGVVPDYSASLIVLGMVFCLIDSLHGPLWISMQATGNIKLYQIIISIALLLNLPLSYLALDMGYSPNSILYVQIVVSIFVLIIRLIFSSKYAKVDIAPYIKGVLIPIMIVTILSIPLPVLLGFYIDSPWSRLIVTLITSTICIGIVAFLFGMTQSEKEAVIKIVRKILKIGNDKK